MSQCRFFLVALVSLYICVFISNAQAQAVVEYIHTDALGTPVAVTDANRSVIERSEYEPFGQLLNRPLTDGPGFTGHVQDAATGLTYMQQRYYDPLLGRFLSVDPVTAYSSPGVNFNRYWYANDNPYRFADPDGRKPKGCGDGDCKRAVRNIEVGDHKIRLAVSDDLSKKKQDEISRKFDGAADELSKAKLESGAKQALTTMVSIVVDSNMRGPSHANMNYQGTGKGGVVLRADEVLSSTATPTYIASQIVHDGGHFLQGFSTSRSNSSQRQEEIGPLRLQKSALESMGAPKGEIEYINRLINDPASVVDYRNGK